MIGELLLYIMTTELRELSDEELCDVLELLVGCPQESQGELEELQSRALDLLEAGVPDRDQMKLLADDFCELLPPGVSGFVEEMERFDELLAEVLEDEQMEDAEPLGRLHHCLELLSDDSDWQARSEAARGLGTLEEEMFQAEEGYRLLPFTLDQCAAHSLVAHRNLLEGFETWREAFRFAHQGELEEALDSAYDGTCLLRAVELWSEAHSATEVVAAP